SGAARDDRAQCGDSHRPDRKRACGRQADMECGGRGRNVPLPPHHAHRHIDRARHDPDRNYDILGPMSYAIMGGLLVATVLTLIFLPALYIAWFRVKQPGATA